MNGARTLALGLPLLGVIMAAPAAHGLTGDEWQRLPIASRSSYVLGVIDGWQSVVAVQDSLGSKDVGVTVFAEMVGCLQSRLFSNAQLVAIVERHVSATPGLLGKDMTDLVFAALAQECKK